MMYRWNFSDIARQINELQYGPYVPPCERHPYYDDPRDVKQDLNEHIAQFAEGFSDYAKQWGAFVPPMGFNDLNKQIHQINHEMQSDDSIELIRCKQCGTYFPKRMFTPFNLEFCDECLKDISTSYRESQ